MSRDSIGQQGLLRGRVRLGVQRHGRADGFQLRDVPSVDGRDVGGIGEYPGRCPGGLPRPAWVTYFAVDDTDEAVDAVVKLGGSVITPGRRHPVRPAGHRGRQPGRVVRADGRARPRGTRRSPEPAPDAGWTGSRGRPRRSCWPRRCGDLLAGWPRPPTRRWPPSTRTWPTPPRSAPPTASTAAESANCVVVTGRRGGRRAVRRVRGAGHRPSRRQRCGPAAAGRPQGVVRGRWTTPSR